MLFDYTLGTAPKAYKCSQCGVTHVKMWRAYMSFDSSLFCARCAALHTGKDISSINANGILKSDLGEGDQIGHLIPAVPTEHGKSYWGYTAVPPEAVKWWQDLPTLSKLK